MGGGDGCGGGEWLGKKETTVLEQQLKKQGKKNGFQKNIEEIQSKKKKKNLQFPPCSYSLWGKAADLL